MSNPATCTLDDVYRRVRRLLASFSPPNQSDDAYVNNFLDNLRSGADSNSARLLVSLGIDINNYYRAGFNKQQRKSFLQLIKTIILKTRDSNILPKTYPANTISPAVKFDHALQTFLPDELKPLFEIKSKGTYVRIANFNSYLRFIVLKNRSLNPDISRAIDKTDTEKLYYDFEIGRKYRTVRVSKLSGKKGWVFLACKDDIEHLIINYNVEELLDNLGFYFHSISTTDKFITFEYPDTFYQPIFQPTSLTGDWGHASDKCIGFGNEFFLPYKLGDDWGRTYSVSGKNVRVKERIHFPLENDDDNCFIFSVAPLGELKAPIKKANLMNILNEALERFEQSL